MSLTLVVALKAMVELAAMLMLARGAVYVLSFGRHHANVVYQLLVTLTRPCVLLARKLTPARVLDRHIPMVTFICLTWVWVALVMAKLSVR